MSVTKEDFVKLFGLQEHDLLLDGMQKAIEQAPKDIEDLRGQVADEKQRLDEAQSRLKELQVRRRDKEREMGEKEELIRKHQTELNSVKTNDAFKALLKEIEADKAVVSDLETEILTLMDEIDEGAKQEKACKGELAAAQARNQEKIKDLEAKKAELEKKHQAAAAKRQSLADGIPSELITMYDKTRERRQGLALAKINGDACTVCHMKITPQEVINVKKGTTIEVCGNCQRILHSVEKASANAA